MTKQIEGVTDLLWKEKLDLRASYGEAVVLGFAAVLLLIGIIVVASSSAV